jgi:tryptophanyl-tRNA synthetase
MKRADTVFSGMRPTGRLHIGNYWGALKNWVELQNRYPCFFSVVDWHMLTTGYNDTSNLQANVREMALDWLAAGLDPAKCVIFRQSDVPEHAELALMLGMVTPLSSVENNPTWKEQLQELSKTKMGKAVSAKEEEVAAATAARKVKAEGGAPYDALKAAEKAIEALEATAAQYELRTYGFLGYPVLQAADILLYHGTKVPVGQDQLPHLELSREIARKFNNAFGDVFDEPQPLLTPTPKVPGTDSRKMSKSYNNAVDIYETAASLEKKIKSMYTDPMRKNATDPGHPEPCAENPPGCSVYSMHKLYADAAFVAKRGDECRAGRLGCGACKKDLLAEMTGPFDEFRRRRESLSAAQVDVVLADGAEKARAVARKTMDEVRRAMRLR